MSPERLPRLLLPLLLWLPVAVPAFGAAAPASATSGTVITITADQSSAQSPPHGNRMQVVYSGHVVIHRGTLTLHGERAVIHTNEKGIESAVVTGSPARFIVLPEGKAAVHGEAATITYTASDQVLTLDGRVRLTRPGESFSAAHATYGLQSRRLSASGSGSGPIHAVLTPASGSSPP